MSIREQLIKRLFKVGFYYPTLERHREHVAACAELGVEPDSFETFAVEVLNTPKDKREWLLADEPTVNYEPFVRFAQYQTPIAAEVVGGFATRRNK
jgi:hypothetical protein